MSKTSTIHCWNCGHEMKTRAGVYEYDSVQLGHMRVPYEAGELYRCDCGEDPYVSASLSERVADYEQKRIEQLLLMSVGGDMEAFKQNLIGMSELERHLGVTRQAVGKSPKYRNRIYHVVMNGDLLWWKPSVDLFKKKGDGRYPFAKPISKATKSLRAFAKLLQEFLPPRSAAMFAI